MSKLSPCILLLSLALSACSNSPSEATSTAEVNGAATDEAAVEASAEPAAVAGAPAPQPEGPQIPEDTEIVTLESGLKYSVLAQGEGGRKANVGDRISMHYTGWLPDGTVFDSSRKSGRPYTFTVGSGVIDGWSEAAQHMGVGDRLKLTIPPDLAYGASGSPPVIPPGATLIFEVEMMEATFMPVFHAGSPDTQITTTSGLVYEVLSEGTGASVADGDVVDMKYAIWDEGQKLITCDQMQNSTLRGACGDLPYEFMNEAARLMKVGSRLRFIVSADLAPLPPGNGPAATTIWELELIGVSEPLPVPEFAMPTEDELTTTESGLAYRVDAAGEGQLVAIGQSLSLNYAGWLTDGTLFDASYKRGEPMDFVLETGGLISGWIEGLQLMRPGAVYTFVIPSELAYGPQGRNKIPANATLVFEISLLAAN